MKLRIFADPARLRAGSDLCPLLLPWSVDFSGHVDTHFSDDRYVTTGHDYFIRTSPSECDVVVCPSKWKSDADTAHVVAMADETRALGKPLVVFCETDSEEPFPVPGVLVFRGSMRRSRQLPNEFPCPAFIADRVAKPTPVTAIGPKGKTPNPCVGFCGNIDAAADAGKPLRQMVKRAVHWVLLSRPRVDRALRQVGLTITHNDGRRARYQALGVVKRSPLIRDNFIIREHFLNGTLLAPKEEQSRHWEQSFRAFRENVLACHYTLCPRGGGNWSYRLYETLCLGRIPVFINTDCVLPYETIIPWRRYCVWVEADRMERAADAILSHYETHDSQALIDAQNECRRLWLQYLSLDGFFRNMYRSLPQVRASETPR